jgi:hypothetical protein
MAEGNPGCDVCVSEFLSVARRLISEPEGLSETADFAWRDDEGKFLSDF